MSTVVIRKNDIEVNHTDWGSLQWLVTGQAGSSDSMTIRPRNLQARPGKPTAPSSELR